MRPPHLLLLTVCCLHLIACHRASADKVLVDRDFAMISITNDRSSMLASQYFDSLQYIALETTPDCLIGNIKNIAYCNSRYFIHDNLGNQILIFDNTGHFLHKISIPGHSGINNTGRVINDFTIDEKREKIYVINAETKIMYAYGFSGKLVGTYRFDFFFYAFEYHPSDDSFIFYTLSAPNDHIKAAAFRTYIAGDIKGNIRSAYGYKNECDRNSHVAFTTEFTKCSEQTLISPKLTDSFYLYKDGAFRLAYAFHITNHISKNACCTYAAERFYEQAAGDHSSFLQKLLPTSQFLYYEYFDGGRYRIGIYDIKNKINKNFSNIEMDLKQYYTNRLAYPQFSFSNQLFSILSPMDIADDSDYVRQTIGNYKKEVRHLLLTTKKNDNPILVHYVLKS